MTQVLIQFFLFLIMLPGSLAGNDMCNFTAGFCAAMTFNAMGKYLFGGKSDRKGINKRTSKVRKY